MSKWANIKDQLSDGSVRIRYFGTLAIIVVAMVIGYVLYAKRATNAANVAASSVASVPEVSEQSGRAVGSSSTPQQATPVYDRLVERQNADSATLARKTGESAVPVIRDRVAADNNDLRMVPQPTAASPIVESQRMAEEAATAEQRQQASALRQQQVGQLSASMKNQFNRLIASWEPKPHQSIPISQGGNGGNNANPNGQPAAGGAPASVTAPVTPAPGAGQDAASSGRVVIKAGDPPDYGQLTTGVNTDEGGPVTAKIVSGPLAGATLLGKAEVGSANAQKTGIHFTVASVPGQARSIAIDAWAIDTETARTAIASSVDNHYLLRYGSLFAASFLGGYSDALMKGGQSQQLVASNSGVVVQTDPYSSKQLMLAGVGNVGKQLSTNMGNVFNRPATIEVENNIGIGILFMADVILK